MEMSALLEECSLNLIVDEFVETILEEARRNDDEEDEIECAQIDSSGKWKLVKFQSTPANLETRGFDCGDEFDF